MSFIALWVYVKKRVYTRIGKQVNTNSWIFDGFGVSCRSVKGLAASWHALNIIYGNKVLSTNLFGSVLDRFWLGMRNCQAVRNRLQLGKWQLWEAIIAVSKAYREVRILSLAAGSAEGVIELLARAKKEGIKVRCLLVDKDKTAIDYALKLARFHGVEDMVSVNQTSISRVVRIGNDFQPQIVEMLGFLDYLSQSQAVKYAEAIRNILPEGGVFLTCNIFPNAEQHFVTHVIDWEMDYKSPESLRMVGIDSGFVQCELFVEPHRIHGVLVSKR